MAGQTVRILPRTDYDLSGQAAGLSNNTIVIARKLDTSRWREAVVLARLHAVTWPNGSSVNLLWTVDGYTDEDPGQVWSTATPTNLITFTQGTDSAPAVKNASIAAPFGPLIQLQLKFTIPAGTGAGTFKPSVSVDLNLKGE